MNEVTVLQFNLLGCVSSFYHASHTLGTIDRHSVAALMMGKLLHNGERSIQSRTWKHRSPELNERVRKDYS